MHHMHDLLVIFYFFATILCCIILLQRVCYLLLSYAVLNHIILYLFFYFIISDAVMLYEIKLYRIVCIILSYPILSYRVLSVQAIVLGVRIMLAELVSPILIEAAVCFDTYLSASKRHGCSLLQNDGHVRCHESTGKLLRAAASAKLVKRSSQD